MNALLLLLLAGGAVSDSSYPVEAIELRLAYPAQPPRQFGLRITYFAHPKLQRGSFIKARLMSDFDFEEKPGSESKGKQRSVILAPWGRAVRPIGVAYWTENRRHAEAIPPERLQARGSHYPHAVRLDAEKLLWVASAGVNLTVEVTVDGKKYREQFRVQPEVIRAFQASLKALGANRITAPR